MFTAHLELRIERAGSDPITGGGQKNAPDGHFLRGAGGVGRHPAYEAFLAPTRTGAVRLRLRLWEPKAR